MCAWGDERGVNAFSEDFVLVFVGVVGDVTPAMPAEGTVHPSADVTSTQTGADGVVTGLEIDFCGATVDVTFVVANACFEGA